MTYRLLFVVLMGSNPLGQMPVSQDYFVEEVPEARGSWGNSSVGNGVGSKA